MQINFTGLSYDAEWYDFETGKKADPEGDAVFLKVRPYPFSKMDTTLKDGKVCLSGQDNADAFKYSLTDWRNILDADGKPLPCTDEVKQKIFDFRLQPELVNFVAGVSVRYLREKEAAERD